jgi:hypothetical protein
MYNILPILAMFKFMDEQKNKLNIKKKSLENSLH